MFWYIFVPPVTRFLFCYSLKHSVVLSGTNRAGSHSSGGPTTTADYPISCHSVSHTNREVAFLPAAEHGSSQQCCYLASPLRQKGVISCYKLQDPFSNYVWMFAFKKDLHIKEGTCCCNEYINVQKLLVRIYAKLGWMSLLCLSQGILDSMQFEWDTDESKVGHCSASDLQR